MTSHDGTAALRRTLGLGGAVTVGLAAMVGAGVFVVWAPAASAAGGWVLLSLALAALVATCNALSSAALASRHPRAGGTYVYGRERLGPVWGYLAGWCFVVGKTASCAAMAMTVGAYLVPGAGRIAGVLAVVLVTGLNLAGVRRSVAASGVIVAVVVCALAGVALAALLPGPAGAPAWDPGRVLGGPVDAPGVLQAAGLIFFAFAGYARVATLGEEVRDPARVIPRAVVLSLLSVLALYALVGTLVLGVLGPAGTAGAADPLARVAALVWPAGWVWVVRAAAGLAAAGALLNLVLVVVLLADLRGAIGFSSFGVLLYYAVANASAWTLRREWAPGSVVPVLGLVGCLTLALSLPLPSVLGGAAAVVLLGLLALAVRRGGPKPVAG